jgi:hypothetical protein
LPLLAIAKRLWESLDADTWGFLLSLIGGYGPSAGAGTLAKLAMATGSANLATQVFAQFNIADAHKSFNISQDHRLITFVSAHYSPFSLVRARVQNILAR